MTPSDAPAIYVADDARDAIERHCFSRLDVEVGGFLLGTLDGAGVHVDAAKAALTAESNQSHLTFTHEAWAEILDVMDVDYPGLSIVGWYHSHPGFGCFLSDYDVFIQENFFSAEGQHALVIDPLAGTWGTFIARDGRALEVGSGTTHTPAAGIPGVDKATALDQAAREVRGRRTWPPVVAAVLVTGVLVGGLTWFLGSVQGQDSGQRSANAALASAQSEMDDLQARLLAAQESQDELSRQLAQQPAPVPSTTEPSEPSITGLTVGESAAFTIEYTVSSGDSLWSIAQRFLGRGDQYRRILRANPDVRTTGLEPGQVVVVPVRGTLTSMR